MQTDIAGKTVQIQTNSMRLTGDDKTEHPGKIRNLISAFEEMMPEDT